MSPLAPQFGHDDPGARTVDTGPGYSAIIGSPSGTRAALVLTISREYQPGGSAPQKRLTVLLCAYVARGL